MGFIMVFQMGTQPNQLQIAVLGRSHPNCDDFWDGNWLNVQIHLAAGGFRADYPACFRSEEFERLFFSLTQADLDLETLSIPKPIQFRTFENQLALEIESDRLGNFQVRGTAVDQMYSDHQLTFVISLDQTQLPAMLGELAAILEAFPVIGRPYV